nr:ribonuclease 2 [Tanacetum cinerariifolium]
MRILHCVLILPFAILLKIVCWDSSNPLPNSPVNYEVKYYILAVQWPPGVCSAKSRFTCQIDPVPTNFTIHGLWPEPLDLDPEQIANFTEELNEKWPDLQKVQDRESVNEELNLHWPD